MYIALFLFFKYLFYVLFKQFQFHAHEQTFVGYSIITVNHGLIICNICVHELKVHGWELGERSWMRISSKAKYDIVSCRDSLLNLVVTAMRLQKSQQGVLQVANLNV